MRTVIDTAGLLKKETALRPTLAMVLGSGFQHALTHFDTVKEIAYGQLPGFPTVGVTGHAGKLLIGHFGKVPAVILKGRAHYYEGHSMERIVFPIRVLAEFGIKAILLTNAAGGINRLYDAGDFMVIEDHINFMDANPLRGPDLLGLPRFVDLSKVYDPNLIVLARAAAKKSKMPLRSGVYIAVSGPNYETPAEIRAFRSLGADAVGMSTAPEAIVARQYDIAVAGLSCITNKAAGRAPGVLLHQDVLATGKQKKHQMAEFLLEFAKLYSERGERR
jgi:purine-nucleoside phosphorylase